MSACSIIERSCVCLLVGSVMWRVWPSLEPELWAIRIRLDLILNAHIFQVVVSLIPIFITQTLTVTRLFWPHYVVHSLILLRSIWARHSVVIGVIEMRHTDHDDDCKKKLYDERENENEKLILFLLFLILTDQLSIGTPDMSLLTVNSAPFLLSDYCSSIRSSSVSSSLSELASSSLDLASSQHDTLNLEDIKIQLSQCCLTCGVCWKEDHFSFDCTECGGYSMFRPCVTCAGTCGALWTRDLIMVSFDYFCVMWFSWSLSHFILSHLILSLSLILLHRVTLFKVQNGRAPATTCSVISTVVRLKRPRVGWVSSRPTHRRHRYAEWVNSWRAIWGIVSRNWR